MKKGFLTFAMVAGLTACFSAHAPLSAQQESANEIANTQRLELAQKIIDQAYPEATQYEMFAKVADQMEAQMRQSLTGLIKNEAALQLVDDFQAEQAQKQRVILKKHVPLLMTAWAKSFAEIFTVEELSDIKDFVATPSGQQFMQKSPEVMANKHFALANQAYIDETMALTINSLPALAEKLKALSAEK